MTMTSALGHSPRLGDIVMCVEGEFPWQDFSVAQFESRLLQHLLKFTFGEAEVAV